MKRKTVGSTAVGVGGGNDEESVSGGSGSDSDVDASAHDFTAEGLLPEALTSVHMVKTPTRGPRSWRRIAMRCVLR